MPWPTRVAMRVARTTLCSATPQDPRAGRGPPSSGKPGARLNSARAALDWARSPCEQDERDHGRSTHNGAGLCDPQPDPAGSEDQRERQATERSHDRDEEFP